MTSRINVTHLLGVKVLDAGDCH